MMIVLLIVSLLLNCSVITLAYPSAPGTCNMNKMATLGHGPSKTTCEGCYGVTISTDSPSLINIELTGRYLYQGIVLLIKDKYTNKTIGEFQDFDESLFTAVACDDDEDEQDWIEPDSTAVLGHIDAKEKYWPVNVGWNMIPDKPVTELKLQGMIVIDYDNFHLLPETVFKLKRKLDIATTTDNSTKQRNAITGTAEEATSTIIDVEQEDRSLIQQESNFLFLLVFSIMVIVYLSMSMYYRYLKKPKRVFRTNEVFLVKST